MERREENGWAGALPGTGQTAYYRINHRVRMPGYFYGNAFTDFCGSVFWAKMQADRSNLLPKNW